MSIRGGTTPAMAAEDDVVEALIQRGIQLRPRGEDDRALTVCLEVERQDPRSVRSQTFQTVGIVTAIARMAPAGTGIGLLAGDGTEQLSAGAASSRGSKLTGGDAGLMSIACRSSF